MNAVYIIYERCKAIKFLAVLVDFCVRFLDALALCVVPLTF